MQGGSCRPQGASSTLSATTCTLDLSARVFLFTIIVFITILFTNIIFTIIQFTICYTTHTELDDDDDDAGSAPTPGKLLTKTIKTTCINIRFLLFQVPLGTNGQQYKSEKLINSFRVDL